MQATHYTALLSDLNECANLLAAGRRARLAGSITNAVRGEQRGEDGLYDTLRQLGDALIARFAAVIVVDDVPAECFDVDVLLDTMMTEWENSMATQPQTLPTWGIVRNVLLAERSKA